MHIPTFKEREMNKVIILGNLTREPTLSYTPAQVSVVDFGMATNRKWKAQDGTAREEVCFVDCRMFGKRAETINKYVKKGDKFLIEGRLTFDSWEAQDGTKRSKHRINVENFEFVSNRDAQTTSQPTNQQKQIADDDDIPF